MSGMAEVEASILDDLRRLGDPMLQCSYLIECGRALPPMDEALKVDENLVRECEVRTWFVVQPAKGGGAAFQADSDSLIVRGALALVAEVADAGSREEQAAHDWSLLSEPDFARNFTPTQLRGLKAALQRLQTA